MGVTRVGRLMQDMKRLTDTATPQVVWILLHEKCKSSYIVADYLVVLNHISHCTVCYIIVIIVYLGTLSVSAVRDARSRRRGYTL